MKNIKLHVLVLILIVVAEFIGTKNIQVGPGRIVLVPMLYALILGILLTLKFVKVAKLKDMEDASSLIGLTLMLLMARYGTLVGPTLDQIIAASPALILQEFGNLGTLFIGIPVAVLLGLKREAIGGAHSVAREPNVALIGDKYGLDGPEGRGVMGVYICGTVFGTIFIALLTTFCAAYLPFHPYSLAMAAGVGSASMMTASVGTLSSMFPDMAQQIQAFGAASNMLSGLDGLYMSLFIALPLSEWLYRKCYKLKYGQLPEKPVRLDVKKSKKEGAAQ
ncbi:MAG: DUF3100 domain-containing protein [Spirochaetaceae bacterium]|jgi:hypothetical protein|nr:DUF3100 domain-containing protein [Spirochaetaceae bacterium]